MLGAGKKCKVHHHHHIDRTVGQILWFMVFFLSSLVDNGSCNANIVCPESQSYIHNTF